MKTITLKCPDEFTDSQVEFIKRSALNQIETELRKELKVPQADIDACNARVQEVKEAMGIAEQVEVLEPIKDEDPVVIPEPIIEEPIEPVIPGEPEEPVIPAEPEEPIVP